MESCLYNEYNTKIIGIIIFIISFMITKFLFMKYNSKTINKPRNEEKHTKIYREDLLKEENFFLK